MLDPDPYLMNTDSQPRWKLQQLITSCTGKMIKSQALNQRCGCGSRREKITHKNIKK
jgi:hypothetical protein